MGPKREVEVEVEVALDGEITTKITSSLDEQQLNAYLALLWLVDEIRRRFHHPEPTADQVAALLAVIVANGSPADAREADHLALADGPDEATDGQQGEGAVVLSAFRMLSEELFP